MSVTKGGDAENLVQSCDLQLTEGAVDCLLYSTQSSTVRKRRDHEAHHTTDSLKHATVHAHVHTPGSAQQEVHRRPHHTGLSGLAHRTVVCVSVCMYMYVCVCVIVCTCSLVNGAMLNTQAMNRDLVT